VSEIAYAYAKGGNVGSRFVPVDTPLLPSHPVTQLLGWPSDSGPKRLDDTNAAKNAEIIQSTAGGNDDAIRRRQLQRGLQSGQPVSTDVTAKARDARTAAARAIESGRGNISQSQGSISDDYNRAVNVNSVNRHHSGNKAVWDTVGAQSENRADLGSPPVRPAPPTRLIDKDGVPTVPQ
jgi:uncharacterized membrane protein